MTDLTPEAQLDECFAAFDAPIAARALAILARLRELVPGCHELVYDAYNALSIPIGTGEKLGDCFLAVVTYPKHVNLAFNRGSELEDPDGLLEGEGTLIRHIRIDDPEQLDAKPIRALIKAAAKHAGWKKGGAGKLVIKKIYPRKRPRRPTRG